MKKRLFCLLLSLIMVLSLALTGCSEKDADEAMQDTQEEASEATMTLSMYLISENKISAETAAAVQEAVNKITMSKFKTQLVLRYYTEDEYYDVLAEHMELDQEALENSSGKNNKNDKETESATEEETVLTEYGTVQLKYPTISDNHVDIFYFSGYDRLMTYIDEDRISSLTDDVENTSTILYSYIANDYINRMDEIANGIYALPVNAPIGEYTYLLLNKEILAEYNHKASDFTSLTDDTTQYLLDLVSKFNPEYVPLRSFSDEDMLDVTYTRYFKTNTDGYLTKDFSVLGGAYDKSWTYLTPNEWTTCTSIFTDRAFMNQLTAITNYKELGYYGTEADADKPFAVGFMRGGAELEAVYGDEYELVVLETPTFTANELFDNMFAVSSTSDSVARCMEILTHLNTNEEFRNLLLYGVEGEHYELLETEPDEDGKTYNYVKRLNEDYIMAPEKTGNMNIIYPLDTQPHNLTDYYKKQNNQATTDLLLSFTYIDYTSETPISPEHVELLNTYSDEVVKNIKACKTVDELNAYITEVTTYMSTDAVFKTIAYPVYAGEGEYVTIRQAYQKWLEGNQMIVVG